LLVVVAVLRIVVVVLVLVVSEPMKTVIQKQALL
jgi:hypothetical protein